MYNIENFNTSFNRTLRSYNVKKKTHLFSYRKIRSTFNIYGLEVVITSHYSDSKILISNFSFAIHSRTKDNESIHRLSNSVISHFQQIEKNTRPIGSDVIVNRYSDKQLEQFHSVAIIASQHLVLTTIESYINALFNEVSIELLNHQFATTTGGNN
jgi:hypothetical protein